MSDFNIMVAVEDNRQNQANLIQESDMKECFVETGRSSFFGDYLFNQIGPEDHLFRKLNKQIPWERFPNEFDGEKVTIGLDKA